MESSNQIAALEKAVNDSASRTQPIWISWLLFLTYVTASVASVTGGDLLIGKNLKIPILNIELPLEIFCLSVPLFILLFHFYVLLHFDSLASKLQEYNTLTAQFVQKPAERRMLGRRLDDFMLVQILAGDPDKREGFKQILSKAMFDITIILAPIIVLLMIEFKFLPYHNLAMTWWHRGLVALDLVLIWTFSYRIFRSVVSIERLIGGAATCLTLALAFVIAIFPTEPLYACLHNPLTSLLFEGSPDEADGHSLSFFSNRLLAPNQIFEAGKVFSFRGRDLQGAVLSGSDLHNADFTNANLIGSVIREAKLNGAHFGCIDPFRFEKCTDLSNADLTRSQLQQADFRHAKLVGASLPATDLNGADLSTAKLIAADFRSAKLEHAKMYGIRANGASFDDASFSGAELDPHDFDDARLIAVSEPMLYEQASKSNKLANSAQNSSERQHLEKYLEELACGEQGAASGLIKNNFISRKYLGDYLKDIAEKFSNWQNGCQLARDLSQTDLKTLQGRLNAINR